MEIKLLQASQKQPPAELFIAACFEDEKLSKELSLLIPRLQAFADKAKGSGRFKAKYGQTLISYDPYDKQGHEIILLGLGPKKKYRKKCARKASGSVLGFMKERKLRKARVLADSFAGGEVSLGNFVAELSEIAHFSTYEFDKYKLKKEGKENVSKEKTLEILSLKGKSDSLKKIVDRHTRIALATLFTRDLINEPANIMTPPKLAATAREWARKKKLHAKILEKAELQRLKMGGILAVNSGSTTPPSLIILEHGRQYQNKGTICLVGKGVTFDTGGISIKPGKDMEKMKYDMSGAAAVISAVGALADLGVERHVIALAPAVENNVAEDPQRPGDIIRMYNGKTVEVINTDAEGRLILGDALAYCAEFKPKAIIDLATLTGMAAYTFGDKAIAMMGNDEKLMDRIKKAGEVTGEICWPLPMFDEYSEQIKGHHSDLYNVGGAYGGTITAAKFLEEFVPKKTPWVHLDIAGVAWANNNRSDCPKGGTGAGVRLLVELISNWK